jgi:hypothetical protein
MNQENYEFLVSSLERHGLQHEAINSALKTKMKLGKDEFEIGGMKLKFGKDEMIFSAKFGKGKQDGNGEGFYYLNKFEASIKKEIGETKKAEFPLYKQQGFNVNQMHKLMLGRPIYKVPRGDEGRWTKVDFKNTDDNGLARVRNYYDSTTNFKVERELDKLSIPWANQQDKANAISDLKNGEIISSSFKIEGERQVWNVGVSPQIGGLIVYDANMQVIKYTNTQTLEMVGDDISQGKDAGKKNEKLPNQTVELMNNLDDNKNKEGQGHKKKVS